MGPGPQEHRVHRVGGRRPEPNAAPGPATRPGAPESCDTDRSQSGRGQPAGGWGGEVGQVVRSQQVFLWTEDGRVRQLTDPWIEDWRDGLADGDARGNSEPRISADGRYVVVKNTSTTTAESFLLRIDLVNGEVLNLTNGSAGAMATDDAEPSYSPDGRWLTFSWTGDIARGIYLMDSDTGGSVTSMTEETARSAIPGLVGRWFVGGLRPRAHQFEQHRSRPTWRTPQGGEHDRGEW